MSSEPKYDNAKMKSRRMTQRVKWALWLPIPPAVLCWGWLKRFFCRPASREEQKDHQAAIRRELRGLPGEHDGGRRLR